MKPKKKEYPIEHVVWLDHSGGTDSWTDLTDIQKNVDLEFFIHSVGIVVAENKERLVMVQNMDHQMLASHHMTILKSDIVERKKISKVTERIK